jgi:hypothetical protein
MRGADLLGCGHPDLARVREGEVMQGQHGIGRQEGALADAEDGLHEPLASGVRDVVETEQPARDVGQAAACGDLADLNRRDPEVGRVAGRDVAILVERTLVELAAVGLGEHRGSSFDSGTVLKTVRFRFPDVKGRLPELRFVQLQLVSEAPAMRPSPAPEPAPRSLPAWLGVALEREAGLEGDRIAELDEDMALRLLREARSRPR